MVVGQLVCSYFLKGQGSYTSMLIISKYLFVTSAIITEKGTPLCLCEEKNLCIFCFLFLEGWRLDLCIHFVKRVHNLKHIFRDRGSSERFELIPIFPVPIPWICSHFPDLIPLIDSHFSFFNSIYWFWNCFTLAKKFTFSEFLPKNIPFPCWKRKLPMNPVCWLVDWLGCWLVGLSLFPIRAGNY